MSQYLSSLMILRHTASEIHMRMHILMNNQDNFADRSPESATFYLTFLQFILLDTCSYLDEYDSYFNELNNKEAGAKILHMKTVVKPFISEIRKWKDLKNFRNHVVAHNKRRDGRYVFWEESIEYDIPRNLMDLYLLDECLRHVQMFIEIIFMAEIELGSKKINKNVSPPVPKTKQEVDSILINLQTASAEAARKNRELTEEIRASILSKITGSN